LTGFVEFGSKLRTQAATHTGEITGAMDPGLRDRVAAMASTEQSAQLVEAVLVDRVLDAYVEWRERAGETRAAYRDWSEMTGSAWPAAYAAYVAATDRE
jgi:hypothetical protein